jgi:hypothetical protein
MISTHEQGTPEWHAERAGRITGSMINAVLAQSDGKPYKSGPRKGQMHETPEVHISYVRRLAAERVTKRSREQLKGPSALQWGKDVEPVARAAYEARRGVLVDLCGFIVHPDPDLSFVGASPDWIIGEDGGGEIKCPESIEVHIATILDGVPREHWNQIQAGMMVRGPSCQWWDFCSFHPYYPPELRLYVRRVLRDDAHIAKIERACLVTEQEIRQTIAELSAGD